MEVFRLKTASYKLKDVDKQGTVLFVANAFGVQDSHNEISLRGSFKKTLNESFDRLKYLYNHDLNKVIGVPIEGYENETGLIIKAVLNLNKDVGKNTYEDYKMSLEYGRSVEHSIRTMVIKSTGENPRYISEQRIAEVSYVPLMGSNSATPLLEMKSFIEYCYNNGQYTPCYMKQIESVLEAGQSLSQPDQEINNFYKSLKF